MLLPLAAKALHVCAAACRDGPRGLVKQGLPASVHTMCHLTHCDTAMVIEWLTSRSATALNSRGRLPPEIAGVAPFKATGKPGGDCYPCTKHSHNTAVQVSSRGGREAEDTIWPYGPPTRTSLAAPRSPLRSILFLQSQISRLPSKHVQNCNENRRPNLSRLFQRCLIWGVRNRSQ